MLLHPSSEVCISEMYRLEACSHLVEGTRSYVGDPAAVRDWAGFEQCRVSKTRHEEMAAAWTGILVDLMGIRLEESEEDDKAPRCMDRGLLCFLQRFLDLLGHQNWLQ